MSRSRSRKQQHRRPQHPAPTIVPYIASYETELAAPHSELAVLPGGQGLAYRNETAEDRDDRGVLWARCEGPANGRPQFASMHPARQRQTMTGLLCQVCAEPASRTPLGWLFLGPKPASTMVTPTHIENTHHLNPPLCLPCARISSRMCPVLRHSTLAWRAQKVTPYAVSGALYTVSGLGLVPQPGTCLLPYGDPRTRWLLASQLAVRLRGCTIVDLDFLTEPAEPAPGSG